MKECRRGRRLELVVVWLQQAIGSVLALYVWPKRFFSHSAPGLSDQFGVL